MPGRAGKGGDPGWQPGDLAECVVRGKWVDLAGGASSGPARGDIRMVHQVRAAGERFHGIRVPCDMLGFLRRPGVFFAATAFRKIQPRADREVAATRAFREQLRARLRPAGEKA